MNCESSPFLISHYLVIWLSSGHRVPSLTIETTNVNDLDIEPDIKPFSPPPVSVHHIIDPAIVSYERSVLAPPSKAPDPYASSATFSPDELNGQLPSSVPKPATTQETKVLEDSGTTATLSGPFNDLTLTTIISPEISQDQEEELPAKTNEKKKRRRKSRKVGPQDTYNGQDDSSTLKRNNGWGEPPFLEETTSGKKAHPLDGPIHRAEQRLAKARKGRARDLKEDQNGWATEEATDIQDLGDFDFQGNLSKFDKRGVFEQIRQDDTTADEDRLVSFNRVAARPGTNGGKNLHYTENVLDSPKPNGRVTWNSGDDSEKSEDRFSSGRSSRRNLSRASTRKPPSRKGSALIPNDHNSSSGVPRHSSQEHNSPMIRKKASTPRFPKPPTSNPPSPSFQISAVGATCPCVTPLQMLELEQLAISELGLSEDMMTENAARGIAELARKASKGDRVVILAGNHKSGARAIAAGRQLRNHGMKVLVFAIGIEREEDLLEIVRRQIDIYRNSAGQIMKAEKLLALKPSRGKAVTDLIIDALLGIHITFEELRTADQASYFEFARWVNQSEADVMAVDVPSGLDAASGMYFLSNPFLSPFDPSDLVAATNAT